VLVLAVDTSTPACVAGVVELCPPPAPGAPQATLWEAVVGFSSYGPVDARRHGELLAPTIEQALGGLRPAQLDAVVVGLGPGPFTSLRVGIVTAVTFAAALGLPCHGVCSLDGIGAATAGRTGVLTDARRREVFWAAYEDGRRVAGPAVDHPATAAEALSAASVDTVTGPGRALYPDAFAAFGDALPAARRFGRRDGGAGPGLPAGAEPGRVPDYPDVSALAALAADDLLAGRVPGPLTPIYLRRPDAAEPHPAKTVTA
jgi:tRNA threonylcarbamoyl adenosine modification protein YeaZ